MKALIAASLVAISASAAAVSTINPPKPWLTTVGEWFAAAVKKPASGRN